ncbi:MAG TPA: mercuric reductase [Terriglobales bacterium]|nr:mercuric reductase [Terriglobales bacterium]
MEHFDTIVIGSGQAGTPLSLALAEAGRKTVLIERQHVGGTCVNEGCTPTKTMVASARVAYLARRGADYGVNTGAVSVDELKVRERKRAIVERFRGGSQHRMEQTKGLELIFGSARFLGPNSVEVQLNAGGVRQLTAANMFINTGTRASRPQIEGLDSVPALDNVSIMELDVVPDHLLVIGGGYIGLEFGQMFRRFGSRVTIVHSHSQLLTREDVDVAEEIAKILVEDGIELALDSRTVRVSRSAGVISLTVRTRESERIFTGSHLLLAAGRIPNSDSLNLGAAGVATDSRGFIKTDSRFQTNVPGIYALGDVKGGPAFTHISYDDYRIIRANLLEGGNASTEGRLVPYTVFIDPQLGRVGMTEADAVAKGLDIEVAKMPMSGVARALEMDETRGFMKAIVDVPTKQILGAAVLGIEGGEIMAMLEVAIMGRLPYTALRDGIFAHPTLAESFNNLFSTLNRSLLTAPQPQALGAA